MPKTKTQQFAKFYIKDLKIQSIKNRGDKSEIDDSNFLLIK